MTDLKELSQAAQEQVLSAYAVGSNAILEGVRSWVESVDAITPANLKVPSIPGLDNLPTPAEGLDISFEFAQKMLDAQRDFARSLLSALAPAAEKISASKAKKS